MRFLIAIVLFGFSLWLFYSGSYMIGFEAARGDRHLNEMIHSPLFMGSFVAGVLAVVGGGLSFGRGIAGPMIALLGGVGYGVLAVAQVLKATDMAGWQTEALTGVVLIALSAARAVFEKE